MRNLINEVRRHLTDDDKLVLKILIELKKLHKELQNCSLTTFLEMRQQTGRSLFGAIEKDHDGGILGNLLTILGGKSKASNPKTMNGEGIVNHLLGKHQLEAAQIISQMSQLNIFKSGVLMQLIAPVIMGVVGQTRKSGGLDLGGLAKVLLGGKGQGNQNRGGSTILEKLLDRDGDGNMMDDLLNMGMKILKN